MDNFPLGIHLVTIPLTLALGFLIGWIARAAASGASRTRTEKRLSTEGAGGAAPIAERPGAAAIRPVDLDRL
jgi:hypothetical protein